MICRIQKLNWYNQSINRTGQNSHGKHLDEGGGQILAVPLSEIDFGFWILDWKNPAMLRGLVV
jgi:hypothetical protein